jgi:predicted nucleic acid-binding protein
LLSTRCLLLEREAVRLDLQVAAHRPRLRTLMARYEKMDLADASIVVLSERLPRSQVLTADRKDFGVYRRNDRPVIDFIAPPKS